MLNVIRPWTRFDEPLPTAVFANDKVDDVSAPVNSKYDASVILSIVVPCWMRSVKSHVSDGVAMSVICLTAALIAVDIPGKLDRPGIFAVRAVAAAVGTGSRTVPDIFTSYQLSLLENVTLAEDFLAVAVRLKVTLPPLARVSLRQVVIPGVVFEVPTVGVSPQVGNVKSRCCLARKVRTGGDMPMGTLHGVVKLSPPKKGSHTPDGNSDCTA